MRKFVLLGLILASVGFAAEFKPRKPNPSSIRIVPVRPTPEPGNVQLTLTFPKEGQVVYNGGIRVQAQLEGFPVGTNSDFPRAREVYNDPNGQSLLIFVDNFHPIEIYKSFVDSLDTNNLFYNLTLTTTVPFQLKQGMHVIRAFPDRSFGESLKGPGTYVARIFYIGERNDNLDVDLKAPYLTYNEPLETLRYESDKPILLDFYLSNVQLSKDGFKIRVTIDGNARIITQWVPYYIYGLDKGTHTIKLELLNERNEVAPGLLNTACRKITVD